MTLGNSDTSAGGSQLGSRLRLGIDIGGTFTDLVVDGLPEYEFRLFKAATTPGDPARGLLDAIDVAAEELGLSRRDLLGRVDQLVHGTTRATNAIVTSSTARTALLCTAGHPDTLVFREGGGRRSTLDYTQPFPEPYIPRRLTFEVPERITSDGRVRRPLDEAAVRNLAGQLRDLEVEAVAVCLLWSIVNPTHELRVAELLEQELPGVPFTLSHRLNPTIREYRRASSTAIDASLKPLMSRYFGHIEETLRLEGFRGRLLVLTSAGGVLDAAAVAARPIHSVGSGPAAAPVAGRRYAQLDAGTGMAIVTDAGGTTYDVGLVRDGEIPWTRETVVGDFPGHILGFPSVDVRSVGAGGGSIAWLDSGGLLHVGPESAGAEPGPAAYGRGGTAPTVTDAAVVLGYVAPDYFLGGRMRLDASLAAEAIERHISRPLGFSVHEGAAAIFQLACERMVTGIEEITLNQGLDPTQAVMVGGGGGAGLYSAMIARRLNIARVIIPETAAALSATGALLSELRNDEAAVQFASSAEFDFERVNQVLAELEQACERFIRDAGVAPESAVIRFAVEARYPHQNWEFEVPLRVSRFNCADEVEQLRQDFHAVHEQLFAHHDPSSGIEMVTWRASARCPLPSADSIPYAMVEAGIQASERKAFFDGQLVDVRVSRLEALQVGASLEGPVIIEAPATTIVVPPGADAVRLDSGSLLLELDVQSPAGREVDAEADFAPAI